MSLSCCASNILQIFHADLQFFHTQRLLHLQFRDDRLKQTGASLSSSSQTIQSWYNNTLVVSILTCSPFRISAFCICSNSILFYFIELTILLSASFTCLDACCCHGLRLPVFNKETTSLLRWMLESGMNKLAV